MALDLIEGRRHAGASLAQHLHRAGVAIPDCAEERCLPAVARGVDAGASLWERTEHVLSCIYSVFTEGYWSTAGPSAIRDELCDEAVRLSAELCALLPDSRDAQALAALRAIARRAAGHGLLVWLVPHSLEGLWYSRAISEATVLDSWTALSRQLCTT